MHAPCVNVAAVLSVEVQKDACWHAHYVIHAQLAMPLFVYV